MNRMTKTEFVDMLKKKAGDVFTSKASAEKAYDAFVGVLGDSLAKGKDVRLPNVGTLAIGKRAARKGRNPRTGKTINIPASTTVKFRPAKALKDRL